jgi:hypothetical protein
MTKYNGNMGIKITFKDYQYHENKKLQKYDQNYVEELKSKGEKISDYIDPVLEIIEDDENFIVDNGYSKYSFLKKEIESYIFYPSES